MKKIIFWIFGVCQSVSLGVIIFLMFNTLNSIAAGEGIGLDTQLVLSITFPLFLLIIEYMIYSKK